MVCFFWLSCANMVSPTGGPKDETSPLLKKRSLADSAINFKGGKIEFEFNEFIQVKDIQNQLVITPLLKTNPKVSVHKRTLTVNIDDSLLEKNTTYSISLGNSVQDLREGNIYDNLYFTFSTGKYFDSLSLKGTLIEANSGKPDTTCYIVLYPANLPDSAFYTSKPMYIQKVEMGNFYFKNLPDKDFSVYALQDLNKNVRFDMANEKIAFIDAKVNPKDSTKLSLFSFVSEGKIDTSTRKKLMTKSSNANTTKPSNKLSFNLNIDTVNKTKRTFDLNDSLSIKFDHTLKLMDITKFRLFQDDILDASANIRLDSTNKNIIVSTQWSEDALYKVVLLKGFVQDSAGLQSSANEFYFKTKRRSDYGFLTVQCKKDEHDIIELLRNDKVIARKPASDTLISFQLLNPDNYQIRILHDKNGNGLWDTGSFFGERKQPELVELLPAQITIKANWENKVNLVTSFTKKPNFKK